MTPRLLRIGLAALSLAAVAATATFTQPRADAALQTPPGATSTPSSAPVPSSPGPSVEPAASPPVAAPAPAWVSPLPGTCRPPTGGGQWGAPRDGGTRRHQGIDLGAIEHLPIGTPEYAVGAGKVIKAGYISGNAGYGVEVQSRDGSHVVVVKQFHESKVLVHVGQTVTAGQVIGLLGETGDAQSPHDHVEVWVDGVNVNPVPWFLAHGIDLRC